MNSRLALVLAAFSVALVALAATLRPDAFFVGDPGVKLTSARNAIRFPAHPLNIPLPHIGYDVVPHVEPFFEVHGDHTHAITSEFFPLLSAPFLAAAGIRGVYLLPALAFIATLAGCAWLAFVLDARRDTALAAAAAGLGTPFLFYGLEYWEHMPATALGVLGTALLLDAARRRPGRDSATGPTFVAGVLLGGAIVLRAEAACFAFAVLVASRTLVHRPSWRSLAVVVAGAGLALLPLELYTLLHFGGIVPGHIGANAALVGGDWLTERWHLAADWLLPSLWNSAGPLRSGSLWSVAPAAVIAVLSLARPSDRHERGFLWLVAVITISLVVVAAPNTGGGQWGPRYLLFAYVPLSLLAADAVQGLPRRMWAGIVIAVLLAASLWVQRAAYRQLRGTKAAYGGIVDFVAANTEAGGNVVTDVWWLDQLAASALGHQNVLFAGSADTGRAVVRRLSDATVPSLTVFRSREESTTGDAWTTDTCYFEEGRAETPLRGLVAIRLRHRCGYKP